MTDIGNIIVHSLAESVPSEKIKQDGILGPTATAAANIAILNLTRNLYRAGWLTDEDVQTIVGLVRTP